MMGCSCTPSRRFRGGYRSHRIAPRDCLAPPGLRPARRPAEANGKNAAGPPPVDTVKALALVAVPAGVVTLSGPVVAPLGTVAVIEVAEFTVKLALVPLNVTAVAPVKFVPLSVTLLPIGPLVGVKLVIVGIGVTAAVSPPSQPMKAKFGGYASIPTSPVA